MRRRDSARLHAYARWGTLALVLTQTSAVHAAQPEPSEPFEIDDAADVSVVEEPEAEVGNLDTEAPVDTGEGADAPALEPADLSAAEVSSEVPGLAAAQVETSAAIEASAEPVPAEPEPEPEPEPAPAPAKPPGSAFIDHVHVGGFAQVDFLHRQISRDELSDGSREPLNETGFLLRNARLGVAGEWRYVGARAQADFFSNGLGVRPATVDVHAQWPGKIGKPPIVRLSVGLLRVPFGFENHDQTDVARFFGERSLVSHALIPGLFDVGAQLSGHFWAIDWALGVHNGQPVGAPGFGYRDPNRAKDYVGRVHTRGHLTPWFDAGLGFSFLTGKGFSAGTSPTKDSFDWVDLNEDGRVSVAELIPIAGSAGRPSQNFSRWGVGADVQLRFAIPKLGTMMLYAEGAIASNLDRAIAIADPVLLGRDQRGIGWYGGLTQAFTRHASIGFRYDEYYPSLDALEPFDGRTVVTRRPFRTFASGIAAHLRAGPRIRARLLVEYEHQRNSLGRSATGRPEQLPNDTLRVRSEVAF